MHLEIANRQQALKCPRAEIRKVARLALAAEGADGEFSVALVGDAEMAELTRRFLGRRRVTDVLAFPYAAGAGRLDGEVVVNAELAVRQAERRAHGPTEELMLYVVHGLLHLLGYDDRGARQRRLMREREQTVLRAAGLDVEF